MSWIDSILLHINSKKNAVYRYVLFPLIILVFIIYWFFIIVFALPDNYISLQHTHHKLRLRSFINHDWSIFAPSPTFNYRLYYVFESINDPTNVFTYEAIQPIVMHKQEKAPFNYEANILENLIIKSVRSVEYELKELRNDINYIEHINSKKTDNNKFILNFHPVFSGNSKINNLINYAKVIAEKNDFSLKDKYVRVRLTKVFLPSFKERNQSKTLKKEVLFYESKKIRF